MVLLASQTTLAGNMGSAMRGTEEMIEGAGAGAGAGAGVDGPIVGGPVVGGSAGG